MAKNLLAITVAGQLKWLEEAISTLRDPLDVLVIDDATPGDEIRDFCKQKGIRFLTKVKPLGLTNSWNKAYQYFKEHNYDNCILCNDDVRFPAGFSEGIFEGLKEFDLVSPLSNGPGTGFCQQIRRFVNIEPNERNVDRVQGIVSKRYKKAPFRQSYFVNGFCLAFSSSIGKFAFDEQFLFNPANINTLNEYDLERRINERGGKIGICKTSYLFHWKDKTFEKFDRNGVSSGDYREQLWKKEEAKLHPSRKIKLHLGCGYRHLEGYVNIDLIKTPATNLVYDLSKSLPYSNESVELIESYHFIEHLSKEGAARLIKECYRVLIPGSKIIIECPNLDQAIKDYLAGNKERLVNIFGWQRFPGDAHLWGYNFKRLKRLLERVGFKDIQRKKPQDYHTRSESCIRVEAIK